MLNNVQGFYSILETKLADQIKSGVSYSKFLTCLENIPLQAKYDLTSLLNKAKEINKIAYKIVSIISKPYFKTNREEVIIRSELASSLSNESFRKTMQDSKLWKNKRGIMSPSEVHTEETIETIDTYENRFIRMLVDILVDELDELNLQMKLISKSFASKYKIDSLNYSKISLLSKYEAFKYPYNEDFIFDSSDSIELENLIYKLNKLFRKIKASSFYEFLSKFPYPRNIIPTNVLIHNPLYSYCYRYYKDNYLNSSFDASKEDKLYFSYIICLFFNYFKLYDVKKLAGSSNIDAFFFEDDLIEFKKLKFTDRMFEYVISEDSSNLEFNIQVRCLLTNLDELNSITYKVKIVKRLTKKIYRKLIKENPNLLIVCLYDEDNIYDGVLNLTYFDNDQLDLIKNFFTSLTMLFKLKDVGSSRCLCCGGSNLFINDSEISCPNCSASYLMFQNQKDKYVWIKKLWRIK